MPEEMNVQAMQWVPKLIRLTLIGCPDWDEGKPTPCFINPALIANITRCKASFGKFDSKDERHPLVECTAIFFCHGAMHVLETPEQIAMLRDRALGHEPVFKEVSNA